MPLFSSIPLNADHVSTVAEWRGRARDMGCRTAKGAARAYARLHGYAVVMLADDTSLEYALNYETGNVSQYHRTDNFEWVSS